MESIAEPTAAGKDVEALERLDRRQGGGRRPAQDFEDNHYYEGVDRQLVRMGYRLLVRGCKGL